jgi:CheY-like chemotaxis protein
MAHRILVVDDDEATVQGLVDLLRGSGYDASGARTFAEARRALVATRPDLLLVDVRLDAFNGLQLVATNPTGIPVIVITAFPDPTLEAEARRFGADFMLKPIDWNQLRALIEKRLNAGTQAAGQPDTGPTRRWPRRSVTSPVFVRIAGGPARIVDVSYGGLCREIASPRPTSLPPSIGITLPSAALSIDVDVVWHKPTGEGRLMCGGMVRGDQAEWRQFVDAVA